MYKVFIYDKPVLIHKNSKKTGSYEQFNEVGDVNEIISLISRPNVLGVEVVNQNPEKEWEQFKLFFKYLVAAGGAVFNSQSQLLVIFRNGKWDLPKGKLEKGEDIPKCAVREVEEECGVSDLKINKQLPSTYHCYQSKKRNWILKRTFWYEMETNQISGLIPQKEEGIELVKWFDVQNYDQIRLNTFKSIKMVLENL